MDDESVRAEQLLYQIGELGAQLTNAEFADVPLDKAAVTRLLQEAKAVYESSVRVLRTSVEKQEAMETKYDVSTELLLSPCVDKRQCKYMWDAAKADPAVKELVQQLRDLKGELHKRGEHTDRVMQRIVELMKKLESKRPDGGAASPYSMCMMTGFPCSIALIERKTAVTAPKYTLHQAAVSEALRMFEYAKAVTRKYVLELESSQSQPLRLEGGATAALTAAAVYLEAHPDEASEAVQSFYSLLPVPGATRLRALHQLETAQQSGDTLRAFLTGGGDSGDQAGVLAPLIQHMPLRAQPAATRHFHSLWQAHLLHFMGPVPKYSYDAAGDRVHIVMQ